MVKISQLLHAITHKPLFIVAFKLFILNAALLVYGNSATCLLVRQSEVILPNVLNEQMHENQSLRFTR